MRTLLLFLAVAGLASAEPVKGVFTFKTKMVPNQFYETCKTSFTQTRYLDPYPLRLQWLRRSLKRTWSGVDAASEQALTFPVNIDSDGTEFEYAYDCRIRGTQRIMVTPEMLD